MSKRERKGVALCQPYDSKYIKPEQKYFIDPKFNGVRCKTIVTSDKKVYFFSSTEKPINSVPHLEAQILRLTNKLDDSFFPLILDGELYIHGESFQKINSKVSRTVNLHPEHEKVNYYIFDMIYRNGGRPQLDRYSDLAYLFGLENSIGNLYNVVSLSKIITGQDILENLAKITAIFYNEGFEGIVIKDMEAIYDVKRLKTWLKYKPRKKDNYKVIGITEEIDKHGLPKDSMGALEVIGEVNKKSFFVGSGFTKKDRQHIWNIYKETNILPTEVVVKYQELSDDKVPVFPVVWEYSYD
jgi:DNA ligase-1